MKSAWQFFKQYPISLTFYLLYLLLCYKMLINILWVHEQIKAHPENSGIANGGEVIGYSWLLLFIVALIFIFNHSFKCIHSQTEEELLLVVMFSHYNSSSGTF
jgi:hypothetical protein